MPMPGVAGAGAVGERRAGLLADFFDVAIAAGALCVAGAVAATCAGAVAEAVAGATTTDRCVAVAPRSTQRSGSSGHPDASAEPAHTTQTVITAMTRDGRFSFTNGLREEIPVLEWQRLYSREPIFSFFF